MVNPIRVAQIVGKMNGGGVEAVVMNYYRHIDRSKVQFDFLIDSDSSLVPREEIESLGGRVFEIPPYQHVIEYQRELQRLFREEGWKIVHSHINALSVFPLRAAKKAGVPVRIAHSHSTSGKGEYAKNALKTVLKTQANRFPTNKVACSEFAGKWLFGRKTSFSVMNNAIDISQFSPNLDSRIHVRKQLGIADDTFLIGHVGRFVDQKNHDFLLAVFREVLSREPNSVLALVGNGPLLEHVKQMSIDLGISNSVLFLGTRSDVASLYQAFDVFCLPSKYEGLPVVGVECQASGTPILASDAITSEIKLTSLMEFERLSSGPQKWCEHLISMRKIDADPNDSESLKAFDVSTASKRLEDYYSHCLKTVLPCKAIADK